MIKNALSVDLESFVHRQLNQKDRISEDNGHTVAATNYLLDLFDEYNTKVSFFVLGEIFEWYPDLVVEIKKRGHEIGYHGHRHIFLKDKETLLEELKLSKKFIEKYKPIGFRAPRMFLKKEYLKILSDYGFKYDSSVYGSKEEIIDGIKEIPVSMFSYIGINSLKFSNNMGEKLLEGIPYGSGLFISLLQKKIQYFIENTNRKGKAANIFIHPWQFSDYEKISLTFSQKFLYKKKINKTLEYLLSKNKFFPVKDLL